MGCIEIFIANEDMTYSELFNRNMGCIEIADARRELCLMKQFNRNMGCIEIRKTYALVLPLLV